MIKRFCDWCGDQIAEGDLMPVGGGVQFGPARLGMEVRNTMRSVDEADRIVSVLVGPVLVDGLANAHHFHKACGQAIVTSGVVQ